MLSLLLVLRGSKNFTSSPVILMLPPVPVNHYSGTAMSQLHKTWVLFCYSMRGHSDEVLRHFVCVEHFEFVKVTVLCMVKGPHKCKRFSQAAIREAPAPD